MDPRTEASEAARRARERGVFGPEVRRRFLAVRGPDAASHLDAMLTRRLSDMPRGATRYAALLDDRAHVLADGWVLRAGEEWLLDAPAAVAEPLRARLDLFAVAAQVELVDLSETHDLHHWEGKGAQEVSRRMSLGALEIYPGGEGECARFEQGGANLVVAARSHHGERGFTAAVPKEHSASFAAALETAAQAEGFVAANPELLERLRVEAGRLEGGRDVTERDLLPEAGLWAAVSLDKGCFPGQEILQRIASQGQLRRRRIGLRWDGESSYADRETPILLDGTGTRLGEATSWAATAESGGGLALAWLTARAPVPLVGWRLVWGGVAHECRLAEPPAVPLGLGSLAETPRPGPLATAPFGGGDSLDG